jgi:membrane-associated phospholipid phosphatase
MRQFKFNIFILALVWIILAVIFGIYDLDISKQLVNQNSGWAKFLEDYGMVPGILVIIGGIFIYYSSIKQKASIWSYIQKVIFFLVSSGLIFYLFDILLGQKVSDHLITYSIISFAIIIAIFTVLHLRKQVQNITSIIFAKVVVGTALFGYVLCVQVVKYLWGRVRFRELDAAFSQFTPWYLPQGFTGFDSFPSGHAAMGFILLPLIILLTNKKEWIKITVMLLILIWSIVLASSRVVIGAHYASDVLFGSFFIIMTFVILHKNLKTQAQDHLFNAKSNNISK